MKKDFLKAALRSPWAIPAFVVAGILIGMAITVSTIILVDRSTYRQAVQDIEHAVEDDVATNDPVKDGFELRSGAYTFAATFAENPPKLSKEEMHAFLSRALRGQIEPGTEGAYADALWAHMEIPETDYENYCWSVPAIRNMGSVRSGGLSGKDDPAWRDAEIFLLDYVNCEGPGAPKGRIYLLRPQGTSDDLYSIGSVPFLPTDDAAVPEKIAPIAVLTAALRGVRFLPDASLEGLEMPETLEFIGNAAASDAQKRLVHVPAAWFEKDRYRFDLEGEVREIGKATDGTSLYIWSGREDGCLLTFAPDGKVHQYASRMVSARHAEDGSMLEPPSVVWERAYVSARNKAYEDRSMTGCGSMGCANVVSAELAEAGGGLVRAGTTTDGDAIFVPTRPKDHPSIQALYDGWYIPNGVEKPSMDVFLSHHAVPIFYWKDVLGRWVQHQSVEILPMAECGKPVIYLYPEQTTDISVRLPSFINVTVSDPAYPSAGWNVTAQPNGQLTSHEDGKTYGSLYWEGTGVGYMPPTEGFVIKDGEVESFLRNVLPKYGLNETEAREFMEFWLPEMTGAPYYRVSFLTSAWNDAAPLYVSPRPRTSIRIFMDWKPLSAPISLPAPTIVTPEREGFTLVEWGGTLWK